MNWDTYDPWDLMRMLIFGEAEGEGILGQIAVAMVVRNRVYDAEKRFGVGWKPVMLKPYQFSCFNEKSVRAKPMFDFILRNKKSEFGEPIYRQISWIMRGTFDDSISDDITGGANHYLTKALYLSTDCPAWAKDHLHELIGNQVFIKL